MAQVEVEETAQSNKRIAKNTLFMYFRMLITLSVSLYTSRVILKVLGVDDYGIYHTVGGFIALLSFLNGALGGGTSRFLTYELGQGNLQKLKNTFSSVLSAHFILSFIVVIFSETIGLWFVQNKLEIPLDRIDSALWVYHLCIISCVFQITQVPYNACIIAHEKMSVFAMVSIVDAVLKLCIVYFLLLFDFDKLVLYAVLLCALNIGELIFYRIYCTNHFIEAQYRLFWDKEILGTIISYSGWNLLGSSAYAIVNHGTTLLLNIFFSPAVVSARAIANQVNMAVNQFVQNIKTSAAPQIIKRFASGDYDGSKHLFQQTTRLSFFVMLLLVLPICLLVEPLLSIWIGDYPLYTDVFMRLILISGLFEIFNSNMFTVLHAKGRIKENALISPFVYFLVFPISYFAFVNGYSPVVLAWSLLFVSAVIGLIIKPLLIIKIVHYSWSDVFSVFKPCLFVTLVALPFPIATYYCLDVNESLLNAFVVLTISVVSVAAASWFVGLDKEMRSKVVGMVKEKIGK